MIGLAGTRIGAVRTNDITLSLVTFADGIGTGIPDTGILIGLIKVERLGIVVAGINCNVTGLILLGVLSGPDDGGLHVNKNPQHIKTASI